MSSGKLYSISVICINHGLGNDSLWLKQPLSKTFLIVRVISGPFSSSFSQVAFFFPRPVVRRLSSIGRKGIDSLSVSILDILFSFKSLNVTYGHDNVHVGSPCLTERSPRNWDYGRYGNYKPTRPRECLRHGRKKKWIVSMATNVGSTVIQSYRLNHGVYFMHY